MSRATETQRVKADKDDDDHDDDVARFYCRVKRSLHDGDVQPRETVAVPISHAHKAKRERQCLLSSAQRKSET